ALELPRCGATRTRRLPAPRRTRTTAASARRSLALEPPRRGATRTRRLSALEAPGAFATLARGCTAAGAPLRIAARLGALRRRAQPASHDGAWRPWSFVLAR